MDVVNFRQIIEQEFESEKEHQFHISGRECFCTLKKINFSVRSKIERLNQIGIDGSYQYDSEGRLVGSKTTITEQWAEMQEKITDLILGNGIDPKKQNLQSNPMTVRDWKEFATFFPDEFRGVLEAVKIFNGLAGKN